MLNRELWKKRLKEILSLDAHPGHIAVAFAVGAFISITPFFGIHTPMAIAAAFLFRLNKLACITGAWVNTPLTVVPVLLGSYRLGDFLMAGSDEPLVLKELTWNFALELLQQHGAPLLLGSSLIGFAVAIASYFFCYWLVVRFRRKDESQAELTREMEEVGEELEP